MRRPLLLAFLIMAAAAGGASAAELPSGRTTYRHLADYQADMDALAPSVPTLCERSRWIRPRSRAGRLTGLEITRGVGRRDGKPVLLMLGLHHAREWPSGELTLEFAYDLVRDERTDARIRGLLRRARVIVVPVVNPDGFDASRESPIDPTDPERRNRRRDSRQRHLVPAQELPRHAARRA